MTALSTIDDVKAYGGLTTAAADPVLQSLLDAASTMVEKYLGYSPLSASYDSWVNGNGSYLLMLPNRPITAVSKVVVDGVSIPVSAAFPQVGFRFEETSVYLQGYTFNVGRRNVNIGYTAGYANIGALPADIKQAVNELVWTKFKSRDWIGHKSKSLAGETVSYDTSEMSKSVKGYLQDYVRVVPV